MTLESNRRYREKNKEKQVQKRSEYYKKNKKQMNDHAFERREYIAKRLRE